VVIKYLLDEMEFNENDHSDAMAPVQQYFDESLNGEKAARAPPTSEAFNACHQILERKLDHLEMKFDNLIPNVAHAVSGLLAHAQDGGQHLRM
jgi:hypothetical protein